jgi:hypothetical protein
MLSRRTAAIVFGGCLTFGGVAATVGPAFAVDTPPTTTTPSSAPAPYTVTIPGVGTISLTLDPVTGAVSDVLVTPADGLTAGTPQVSTEGVKVVLTAKDGTVHVLEAQVEHDEHGVRVEVEVDTENGEQHQDGMQGTSPESDHKGPTVTVDEHHDKVTSPEHQSTDTHDSGTPPTSQPSTDHHGDQSHSSPEGDGHGHDVTPTSSPDSSGSSGSHD